MEHPELIENAFVNYLTTKGGWTNNLLLLAGENNVDNSDARSVAYVEGDLGEEAPPLSGNRWADVVVELRTPYSKLTAAEKANGTTDPLPQHKANATNLQTVMLSQTLPEDLTAAQANFTCFGLSERTPMRKQDGNYWGTGWKMKIYSCPSAIPA